MNMHASDAADSALAVSNLRIEFQTDGEWREAVSGVNFELRKAEILGLVGESGCGKSTVAYGVLRLLPSNARLASGRIHFGKKDLATAPEEEIRRLRGSSLGMIFQNPMTALDPVYRIGTQIEESLREHLGLGRVDARKGALALLRNVAIPAAEERLNAYPHELSGGMRQRVALAIAIACQPEVLIADEPTTALDVTIQAQILGLIRTLLVEKRGAGVLLITHDLGVVARFCDRVAIMYAGEIVETGSVDTIFADPLHPYTRALLGASPSDKILRGQLATIPGRVPKLAERPPGCRFRPRCANAREVCGRPDSPPRIKLSRDREVACVLHVDR
jgi:oligopeptide/dipeptide ABC transporter ATP-binding protein